MLQKLRNEPIIVSLLAKLALGLSAKLGIPVTAADLLDIMMAVDVVLSMVARAHVTPNTQVEAKVRASMPPTLPQVDAGEDLEQTPVGRKP